MKTFHIAKYLPITNPSGVVKSPLAVYHFDSTLNYLKDRTTNVRDLTKVVPGSDMTFVVDTPSGLSGAYFDSSQDHEFIALDSDVFRVSKDTSGGGDASLTIEVIVKQISSSAYRCLFECGATGDSDATTNLLYGLRASNTTGYYYGLDEYGSGVDINLAYDIASHLDRIEYVALTVSADGQTRKLYVNGRLVKTLTTTAAQKSTSANVQRLRLGRSFDSNGDFRGYYYSFRITDETFSDSSILSAYESLSGPVDESIGPSIGLRDGASFFSLGGESDRGEEFLPVPSRAGLSDAYELLQEGLTLPSQIALESPTGMNDFVLISKDESDYIYGVSDSDGRAFIGDSSTLSSVSYYEPAGEPWNAPSPGDGYYGYGRDGTAYYNGSPCGPTGAGAVSFGTMADGLNCKDWGFPQEPMALGVWATNMHCEMVSDDHVKIYTDTTINDWRSVGAYSRLRWCMIGDFDVEVRFENYSKTGGTDGMIPGLQMTIDDNNHVFVRRQWDNNYRSDGNANGSWPGYGVNVSTTDTYGRLRLTRVGNTIRRYRWNNGTSAWAEMGSSITNTVYGKPAQINIGVGGTGNLKVNRVDIFGFVINSGTVSNKSGWYREAAGTHRGSRRDFPDKALIIATKASVNIIDIDNNKLWWRAIVGSNYGLHQWSANAVIKSAFMKNGRLFVAMSDDSSEGALVTFDFTLDGVICQKTEASSISGAALRAYNGVYFAGTGQPSRDSGAVGQIASRHAGGGYSADWGKYRIKSNLANSASSILVAGMWYWATGHGSGVSIHSHKQAYMDGSEDDGLNYFGPRNIHHALGSAVYKVHFDSVTNDLYYMTTSTLYSISFENIGDAYTADPDDGLFSQDYSKSLPGTRSYAWQDTLVTYGGYVFIARDEGIYRVSWPSGSWTLFYGKALSGAVHEVLPSYGSTMTLSLTVDPSGPTDLLLVGMQHGVAAVNIATNSLFGTTQMAKYSDVSAVVA